MNRLRNVLITRIGELLERDAREVDALRAAVRRIDRGTYGECVTCGGRIAPARLAALPTAMQCVDCARATSHAA